jgi:hypothetical protein
MLAQVLNTLGWFERYAGPNATEAPTEPAPAP